MTHRPRPQTIRQFRERLAEAEQAIREAWEHEDLSFCEEYYLENLAPRVEVAQDSAAVEAYLRLWDAEAERLKRERG